MDKEVARKYIPLAALAILVILSFLIVKSYIVALTSAFILAYLFYPLNKILEKKIPKPASAIIIILIALAVILVPITGIITELSSQAYKAVQSGAVDRTIEQISQIKIIEKYSFNIKEITKKALELSAAILTKITLSIASAILSLFVMIFAMYYMLTEWSSVGPKIKKYIPFTNKDQLVRDIADATKKVIHGTLFIAIIEFVISSIGFWLAGSNFFLLLATMTALLAFIPGGPGIVWIPAMIIELIQKDYLSAGIILAFGLFISIYIDTILRTKIAGKNARIHPLVALIGILGGTSVFGIPGIIIGPLFLSYTLKILEEIIDEY